MAIPLRKLTSPQSKSSSSSHHHHPHDSLDSETSAILSYALGNREGLDADDEDEADDSPRGSTTLDEDEDEFFKENDPLTSDYEPFPLKKKSRRFRIFLCAFLGVFLLVWLGALIGYLSKGYFKPHQAPASPIAASRRITFDQVANWEFGPRYQSLEWTSSVDGNDGVFLLRQRNEQIIRANVNGTRETILYESDVFYPGGHRRMHFDTFSISGDEEYILLATQYQKNWRHSYSAIYYVYHIASKSTVPLVPDDPDARIDYAIWSPTKAKIAYVLNHDVYIRDMTSSTERVTFDGGQEIFNGVADWVFEEEVFASSGCLWWSPSSTHLAYIHINETLVPIYSIPYYIPENSNKPMPYPKFKDIKYPKPGYPNPVIDVYIHTTGSSPWKVTYPEPINIGGIGPRGEGDETDGWGEKKLITNVEWMGDDKLVVSETNRVSDHFRGVLVDVNTQSGQIVRDDKIEDGWFEISHYMRYIPADALRGRLYDGYIDVVERDGYKHLGYFSPLNASTPQYITGGNWEVTDGISAFDPNTNLVYFLSTRKSPVERHLYSIHLSGQNMTALTDTDEDGFYEVSFSTLAQYYQLSYTGPEIPYQKVLSTTDPDFSMLLEDNSYLVEKLRKIDLPKYKYGTIEIDGFRLNYKEIRPPNFDDSGNTKYPVLFHCYGGPGSQTVQKKFLIDWHRWLASEPRLEYLVVEVDGRGTGFMGRKSRVGVRKQLGVLESRDQAAAAAIWKKKSYVDPEKIALWGWSFGGFLTLKTIESHPGVFPYGMAVAPVTDWRYYDSIYTERYMLTPHSNLDGYRNSAIVNTTAMGETKRFFMAHGTGDDNVHIQNSLTLMDRLTSSGIGNWDSQVFTDDDHSIAFHGGNRAIYWRLAVWLERWFGRKQIGGRIWETDGE